MSKIHKIRCVSQIVIFRSSSSQVVNVIVKNNIFKVFIRTGSLYTTCVKFIREYGGYMETIRSFGYTNCII